MIHLLLAIIYLSFISLGLPDALLGSAWPSIYPVFDVPVSYAGIIFMIIASGTVISSLQSDRLTKRFGVGKLTAVSVATTAVALFGFSVSSSFLMLCLWAIPYGLGAGSVDAALNNYVALHYASHHMNWLHCMWGVGATAGPYIMGFILTSGLHWNKGYLVIAIIQLTLTICLFLSLPLWKKRPSEEQETAEKIPSPKALSLSDIVCLPGTKAAMLAFFCYCALEQTAGLWASSFLVLHHGLDSTTAATYASLFFLGITVGRGISGFIAIKMNDSQMIRLGCVIILGGIIIILLPLGANAALLGLILVGLGCAPIYPCMIHATPIHFGADKSQAIIGVEMASAYTGNILMPPLFGLIANHISIQLFPFYMLGILVLMFVMHEKLIRKN